MYVYTYIHVYNIHVCSLSHHRRVPGLRRAPSSSRTPGCRARIGSPPWRSTRCPGQVMTRWERHRTVQTWCWIPNQSDIYTIYYTHNIAKSFLSWCFTDREWPPSKTWDRETSRPADCIKTEAPFEMENAGWMLVQCWFNAGLMLV